MVESSQPSLGKYEHYSYTTCSCLLSKPSISHRAVWLRSDCDPCMFFYVPHHSSCQYFLSYHDSCMFLWISSILSQDFLISYLDLSELIFLTFTFFLAILLFILCSHRRKCKNNTFSYSPWVMFETISWLHTVTFLGLHLLPGNYLISDLQVCWKVDFLGVTFIKASWFPVSFLVILMAWILCYSEQIQNPSSGDGELFL